MTETTRATAAASPAVKQAGDPLLKRRITDAVYASGAQKTWAENQASRHGLNFEQLLGFQTPNATRAEGVPSAHLDRKALTVMAQLQQDVGSNKHSIRKPLSRPQGQAAAMQAGTGQIPAAEANALPPAPTAPPSVAEIFAPPRNKPSASPEGPKSLADKPEAPPSITRPVQRPAETSPFVAAEPSVTDQDAGAAMRGNVLRTYRASPSYESMAKDHQDSLHQFMQGLKEESFLQDRDPELGALSAQFESGPEGVAAIGYDRVGGTSYGKYQLSSRAGTMDRFIAYLRDQEPKWADRLEASGKANTRGRAGAMPDTWRQIAKENPARFEELQDSFIAMTNYHPAKQAIEQATKVDLGNASSVLQEVLHSTAVQHGPGGASRIFINAIERTRFHQGRTTEEDLIEEVYRVRKQDFGSSSWRVRKAVKARLSNEMDLAIDLLKQVAVNEKDV